MKTMDARVAFNEADFQPLEQFEMRWRWTEEKYNILPLEELATIRPFTPQKAKELFIEAAPFVKRASPDLADTDGRFLSISRVDTTGEAGPVRQWLEQQDVPDDPLVVVSWMAEVAILTCWSVFCHYWDDFCYPSSDDVDVWPLSHEWRLVYAHYERLSFGRLARQAQSEQATVC